MPTRVSAIVILYNEEKYIGRCLECLARQTYPHEHLEVLLCDGGSTDRSLDIARSFESRLPNLRILHNRERRAPQGLNLGVRESTGDAVIIMGSHCVYKDDYVARCVEVLEGTGAACVGGRMLTESSGTGTIAEAIRLSQESSFGTGGSRWRSGGEAGYVDTVPYGCYRREVFDRVGLFDKRLPRNQDNEMSSRIIAAGYKIYFDPRIESTYFTRASLRACLRMHWMNGYYHCMTWRLNPRSLRPRHLIPMLFFLGLLGTAAMWLVCRPLAWIGTAVLAAYLLLDLYFSVRLVVAHGARFLTVMPWLFPLTHLVYGCGTLAGLAAHGLRRVPDNPEVRGRPDPIASEMP